MRTFGPNIVIRAGRSRVINSASMAAVYERDVHQCLLSLMMFRTGGAVLAAIDRGRHRVRIVPWLPMEQNAEAEADDERHATSRGLPVRDGRGRRITGAGVGTGRGSGSIVRFTPWMLPVDLLPRWQPAAMQHWQNTLHHQPAAPGMDADEVLLHELVHAVESMHGQADGSPLGHELDTVAEFNAIVVVNLQARERARPYRRDHQTEHAVPAPTWVHSSENEFWRLVETFRARHSVLCRDLAAVPVDGNPFVGRARYRQVDLGRALLGH